MRLQIGSTFIASVTYHLELRLRQKLTRAIRPVGKAQVEVTVCQQIAAGIVDLSVYLECIPQPQVVGGVVLLAVQVDEMHTVKNVLIVIVDVVGICGRCLLLRNGIQYYPQTLGILHLHLHELVELAIGVAPRQAGLACGEHFLCESGWTILWRRRRHKVILAVVAQIGADSGIILSGLGEVAVLV